MTAGLSEICAVFVLMHFIYVNTGIMNLKQHTSNIWAMILTRNIPLLLIFQILS